MDEHHDSHRFRRLANKRALLLTLAVAGGYMAAEIVGRFTSISLELLAHAGHMFSEKSSSC